MTFGDASASRAGTAIGYVALGLGTAIALSTIAMVIVSFSPVPVLDQWDNLIAGHAVDWTWLIAQHNEHRLLFPRLVFILDHALGRETNRVDLTISLFLVGVTCGLLVYGARRSGLMATRNAALWTIGLATGVMFSAIQMENFTWGFQVQFFGASLLAVASLLLLVLARPTPWTVAGVVVLEAMGLYTLSSGIVTLILTVMVSLWLGRPRSHAGILSVAGALLVASYLHGYVRPPHHSNPAAVLSHLRRILRYALTEIGGPISNLWFGRWSVAEIAGALGVAAILFHGLRASWHRRTSDRRAEIAWLALAAFATGVAVLTALGRSDFGPEQALSSRYTTPMSLFWLALIMLTAMEADRRGRWVRGVVRGAGLVWLGVIVANQPLSIAQAMQDKEMRRTTVPAILAGVNDKEMLTRIFPSADAVLTKIPSLREDRASVFVESWTHWLGGPLPGPDMSTSVPPCPSTIDPAVEVGDEPHPGWRVTGLLAGGSVPELSDRLVFLDPKRNVVGYGLAAFTAEAVGKTGEGKHQWLGEIADPDPTRVTGFVLGRDDRLACRLGTLTPER